MAAHQSTSEKNDQINEWINETDAPLHYWCIVDAPADVRLGKIEAALKGGRDYLVNEIDHTKNPADNRGTPLHCALDSRSASPQENGAIIDLLIKYGADPELKDAQGRTAIDICSPLETNKFSAALLTFWKEVLPRLEKANRYYATNRKDYGVPLHHFPFVDSPIGFLWPMYKAAIDAGRDVNELDPTPSLRRNQGTPLHCAVTDSSIRPHEHIEMVKLLLSRGADPRIKGKYENITPLEELQESIKINKKDGRDVSYFEKYLKLLEEAAQKLDEKEAREKEGLLGAFTRFIRRS